MRKAITVLTVLLLASALGVSEAAAYGGGGFYGSGRGIVLGGDNHFSVADGKVGLHQHALHRKVSFPDS